MPRFSVVIPAYNAVGTISATIGSVLAQSETEFELIVVDDGSADQTPTLLAEMARADPRIALVEQANTGTSGARNAGVARASAGYVSFLDNDDLWMPRYLERMGAALDSNPGAGFAYCDAWVLDDRRRKLRRRTELEARPGPAPGSSATETLEVLARSNFVMSSATVRREALERAGGFATTVLGTDDYDLWIRILLDNRTAVQAAPTPLLIQRDRHDSQSKDDRHMTEGTRRVFERAIADPRTPGTVREICERRLRSAERGLEGGWAGGATRALNSLRARAVAWRDRIGDSRIFYDEPPAEVVAAFPELAPSAPRSPASTSA